MRPGPVCGTVVTIALLVAGPAPRVAATEQPDHRAGLVEEMLRRRAAAFIAGDEAGWLADVDPAHPETVAYERSRFRQLRGTGPSFFRLLSAGTDLDRERPEAYVRQVVRWPGEPRAGLNTHTWCVTFRDERVTVTAVRAYLPGV